MTSRKVMTQPGVIKTRHPVGAVRVVREMRALNCSTLAGVIPARA